MKQNTYHALLRPYLAPQATTNVQPDSTKPYWEFSPHLTLQDLFREAAGTHAEKAAVVFGRAQITFRELDAVSNQLAHYLTAQGIGKGDLVPVWMDRAVNLIVSIVGIQKAGAAYIPIDSSYPEKRVGSIIADSGPNW